MDAQQFLAEFGHIANAPGGVARLRELVLQLAMQGKLVSQSSFDTPASSLLENIESEKDRLVKAKEIKKPKPLPSIKKSSLPYQLPTGWEWTQFPNCYFAIGNKTNQIQAKEYLDNGRFPVVDQGIKFIVGYCNDSSKLLKIDTPVVVFGDHTKNLKYIDFDFVIGADGVKVLRPYESVSAKFMYIAMQSFNLGDRGYARHFKLLNEKLIPLPPLEEQSRIVDKVDELMALCDQLEAQQQKRRTLQNHLRQATLQAVAASQSPHELQESWQRLQDNFGQLFSAPEDVADLRQAILELVFSGNVTQQTEKITPELITALRQKMMQLSAEKRIKREKPVIDFAGITEMLRSIPDQWAWVRLADIASVVRGGSPRPAGDPKFYGGDIPFLKVADVTAAKGMFVERHTATITEAGLNKTREINSRTVLLTNSGATLGVPAICDFRTTFNDGIAAFIELSEVVFDEYLYLYLKSKTKWLQDIASRGQGQPNLNTEIIRAMWFPLAPLEEQHRVVNRVSELMRFCDNLEINLKDKQLIGERLAAASVANLTGIAIEQEEEPMKAPQTELLAPVRLGTPPDIKALAPLATILARHNGEMSAKDLWQRFGGEIDAFYTQLKTEVSHGWILEPTPAEVREKAVS